MLSVELVEASRKFYDSSAFTGMELNSQLAVRSDIRQFQRFIESAIPKGSLTSESVRQYFDHCKEELGYSRPTLHRKAWSLRNYLNWLQEENLIPESIQVPNIPHPIGRQRFAVPLTEDEVRIIYQASQQKPRDAALFSVALETGSRSSQIVALNTQDVTGSDHFASLTFTNPRSIAIVHGEAAKSILNYKDMWEDGLPLFTNERGERRHGRDGYDKDDRLTRQGLWLVTKSYGPLIDKPNLRPNNLRATYKSRQSPKAHS